MKYMRVFLVFLSIVFLTSPELYAGCRCSTPTDLACWGFSGFQDPCRDFNCAAYCGGSSGGSSSSSSPAKKPVDTRFLKNNYDVQKTTPIPAQGYQPRNAPDRVIVMFPERKKISVGAGQNIIKTMERDGWTGVMDPNSPLVMVPPGKGGFVRSPGSSSQTEPIRVYDGRVESWVIGEPSLVQDVQDPNAVTLRPPPVRGGEVYDLEIMPGSQMVKQDPNSALIPAPPASGKGYPDTNSMIKKMDDGSVPVISTQKSPGTPARAKGRGTESLRETQRLLALTAMYREQGMSHEAAYERAKRVLREETQPPTPAVGDRRIYRISDKLDKWDATITRSGVGKDKGKMSPQEVEKQAKEIIRGPYWRP